jgi:hypothetical protein
VLTRSLIAATISIPVLSRQRVQQNAKSIRKPSFNPEDRQPPQVTPHCLSGQLPPQKLG